MGFNLDNVDGGFDFPTRGKQGGLDWAKVTAQALANDGITYIVNSDADGFKIPGKDYENVPSLYCFTAKLQSLKVKASAYAKDNNLNVSLSKPSTKFGKEMVAVRVSVRPPADSNGKGDIPAGKIDGKNVTREELNAS